MVLDDAVDDVADFDLIFVKSMGLPNLSVMISALDMRGGPPSMTAALLSASSRAFLAHLAEPAAMASSAALRSAAPASEDLEDDIAAAACSDDALGSTAASTSFWGGSTPIVVGDAAGCVVDFPLVKSITFPNLSVMTSALDTRGAGGAAAGATTGIPVPTR